MSSYENAGKPSQPESSGLQPVVHQFDDAPEVVPSQQTSLLRNQSTRSPEVWTPPATSHSFTTDLHNKQQTSYSAAAYSTAAYSTAPDQAAQETRAHYGTPPEYYGNEKGNGDYPAQPAATNHRRICGIKRKTFFIVLGVIIFIIVIIAAVVGGVVGSRKSSSSNSPSVQNNTSVPINAESQSGLASLTGSNGVLYTYYQHSNGSIMEHMNSNNNFSASAGDSVVFDGAYGGSPIAVTSYNRDGATRRQVFFLGSDRKVNTIHTVSGSGGWTGQTVITSDAAVDGSPALSACAASNAGGLNGIRIYYASSTTSSIHEVGQDATESDSTWHQTWKTFPASDASSGAACALSSNMNHLYLRNASTGALQQWTWDYTQNDNASWVQGATGPSNVVSGADIAATYDGSSNDVVFWQGANSQVNRGVAVPGSRDLSSLTTFAGGNGGTGNGMGKIAAVWVAAKNAAVVLFQDSNQLKATFVGQSSSNVAAGTVLQ